jgi:cytochrome oxidase assembly protein ShyY1
VYRFLGTPRWVALAAAMIAAAAIMALLGRWQLARYEARSSINSRIDAAATAEPVPASQVLPADGQAPLAGAAWTRVTATGVYDVTRNILVRGRTAGGQVGFEVVTPLRSADGSTLLVNRGWIPPNRAGAAALPSVPPAPTGSVTVVGRVHPSESGGRPVDRGTSGTMQVRRIAVPEIARALPYPVYGAYLVADPPEPGFAAVPVPHENAWQNAAYVVQWWLLAALTVVAFGYLARREARADTAGYGRAHERAQRADLPAQRG